MSVATHCIPWNADCSICNPQEHDVWPYGRNDGEDGDGPAPAPDAPAARVTAIVRQDWRYRHEYAVEHNREGVDTLTSDLDVAKARVASVLDSLGRKGSAGVWLDNDSLLAIRHVLVALAARVPVEGER